MSAERGHVCTFVSVDSHTGILIDHFEIGYINVYLFLRNIGMSAVRVNVFHVCGSTGFFNEGCWDPLGSATAL